MTDPHPDRPAPDQNVVPVTPETPITPEAVMAADGIATAHQRQHLVDSDTAHERQGLGDSHTGGKHLPPTYDDHNGGECSQCGVQVQRSSQQTVHSGFHDLINRLAEHNGVPQV